MEQYRGKSILKKIAIGKVLCYEKNKVIVSREKPEDDEAEVVRFDAAREAAGQQLQELYNKAVMEVGEKAAAIFEVHGMMLDDDDYCESVYNIIRTQHLCAEYATAVTGDKFAKMFSDMDNEYMKARAADISDISDRLVNVLSGHQEKMSEMTEPVILAADDLAPGETVQMDQNKLLGFVTRYGSANSHTAILARTMNIPALVEVEIKPEWNGKMAIIDGYEGTVVIDPDAKTLASACQRQAEELRKQELLKSLRGKETVTSAGKKVHLYANIGSVSDTGTVLLNDAEGIGLFRSEFLYLEANDFPSEHDQFIAYKIVAEYMAGKKVIIRTLDIGADKQVDYFNLDQEVNPALGYRAIRICLTQQQLFMTQLRALLRASWFGNISIMFPMIISLNELLAAKAMLEAAKRELQEEGIRFKNVEVGVMIETPAAVMISEELAGEADFFSIGTNDLTQYTLAIDRQNPKLDQFYDAHHPAILKMIEMTVENAHKHGAWVGICGELGADMELIKTFVKMGIDELSVAPFLILPIREIIRSI